MNRCFGIVLALLFTWTLLGCGPSAVSTSPLTEEQKQKIKEQDKKTDDEERSGSGTATPGKKKR